MAKVDALIRWFMPKEERFHELDADRLAAPIPLSAGRHTVDLSRNGVTVATAASMPSRWPLAPVYRENARNEVRSSSPTKSNRRGLPAHNGSVRRSHDPGWFSPGRL
mgnify:CR=1 FL=1